MKVKKRRGKKIFLISVLILLILAVTAPFAISGSIKSAEGQYLISEKEASELGADCILVLGAGLKPDGKPSDMLRDRLEEGIRLYQQGAAPKLLLSGDNGQVEHDEVNAMKEYVLAAGIPSEDIFLDHAGFSTYESMYRARDIFLVKKAIVVTQRYHQYRSLYLAHGLGLDAWGVVSEPRIYAGQNYRDLREILARDKALLQMIVKPKPTYLGNTIPISGSGLASHD